MGPLGFQEIILIFAIAMLLFGPKKLPEIGRSLGKGIREFKKSTSGLMDSLNVDLKEPIKEAQTAMIAPASVPKPAATPKPTATPMPVSESALPAETVKPTVLDFEDGSQ